MTKYLIDKMNTQYDTRGGKKIHNCRNATCTYEKKKLPKIV